MENAGWLIPDQQVMESPPASHTSLRFTKLLTATLRSCGRRWKERRGVGGGVEEEEEEEERFMAARLPPSVLLEAFRGAANVWSMAANDAPDDLV